MKRGGDAGTDNKSQDRARRFVQRFLLLTGYRIRSAHPQSLPRELLRFEVPAPDALVRTYRDELEPRTRHALWQHEPASMDEAWTIGRLLTIRGFGVYSLLDLLAVLAQHGRWTNRAGQGTHAQYANR